MSIRLTDDQLRELQNIELGGLSYTPPPPRTPTGGPGSGQLPQPYQPVSTGPPGGDILPPSPSYQPYQPQPTIPMSNPVLQGGSGLFDTLAGAPAAALQAGRAAFQPYQPQAYNPPPPLYYGTPTGGPGTYQLPQPPPPPLTWEPPGGDPLPVYQPPEPLPPQLFPADVARDEFRAALPYTPPTNERDFLGGVGAIGRASGITEPLPYAEQAADFLGDAVGAGARIQAITRFNPVIGPSPDRAETAGRILGEAVVPRTFGELGLEALPGIGFGPDIARGGRALARTGVESVSPSLVRRGGIAQSIGETATRVTGARPPIGGAAIDPVEQPGTSILQRVRGVLGDQATRESRPRSGGIFDEIAPTEPSDRGLIRRYEGRTGIAGMELQEALDTGNALLREANIGRFDGTRLKVKRSPEMEQLFRALHGEGPPPERLQSVYDDVRRLVAQETEETLAADPNFIPRDDYFYRGWKQPKQTRAGTGRGQVGATPGFKKPRVDATFGQLLDEGWEPASWNPYEMVALRRTAGVQFREQKALVEGLKEVGMAVPAEQAPDGWRVPRVGPAFEGKQYPFEAADDALAIGRSPAWAVPNKTANVIENIFGARPDLGALGRVIGVGQRAKQAKLMASLFQQVDFTGRTLGSLTASTIDELAELAIKTATLHPRQASAAAYRAGRNLVQIPQEIAKLPWANVSGGRQASLRSRVLSNKSLYKNRPGITLRGVGEQGWKRTDISITTRDVMRDIRQAVTEGPPSWLGEAVDTTAGAVARRVKRINAASQRGLFDGVYVQAQEIALRKQILPRLMRQHPDWTDQQIMAAAAVEVNKMFSTLANYQSVIQNPTVKELSRGLIFSTNESEALLRGAASTVVGPNKRLWTEFYMGTFLALGAIAALVHKATTGEWLPTDRLSPITTDNPFGPLPIGYNNKWLAPDIPILGRGGARISLDLVAQMDTVFRLLDPIGFAEARENVLPRAILNQLAGEDFFGRALDTPQERIGQFASDIAEPIGIGQIRSALGLGPELEGRLGRAGQAIQGGGINLRAETTPDLRDRLTQDWATETGATRPDGSPIGGWGDLSPSQRRQVQAANPEQFAEIDLRTEEGAERGSEFSQESVRLKTIDEERIESEQEAERIADSNPEFRQMFDDIQAEAAAKRAQEQKESPFGEFPEPTDPFDKALDDYYGLFEKARLPGGSLDYDVFESELKQLQAEWTPEQQQYVDENTGLAEHSELGQELIRDRDAIRESGYWNAYEEIFPYWLESDKNFTGLTEWEGTPNEFFDAYEQEVLRPLAEQRLAGAPPDEIEGAVQNWRAQVEGTFTRMVADSRREWRAMPENKEVAALIRKWGYGGNARTEREERLGLDEGALDLKEILGVE